MNFSIQLTEDDKLDNNFLVGIVAKEPCRMITDGVDLDVIPIPTHRAHIIMGDLERLRHDCLLAGGEFSFAMAQKICDAGKKVKDLVEKKVNVNEIISLWEEKFGGQIHWGRDPYCIGIQKGKPVNFRGKPEGVDNEELSKLH